MQLPFELPHGLVHAICHYHRQWIPGDERGFRSRAHRIHSSGDYRNRPPIEEHAGLRIHVRRAMTGPAVQLRVEQRAAVGASFLRKLLKMNCRVVIVACGPTHVHAMFEPTENDFKGQVGKAKQYASLKCPDHRGQLWAESCDVSPVKNERHACELLGYIDDHRDEGAWIWRYDRDAMPL